MSLSFEVWAPLNHPDVYDGKFQDPPGLVILPCCSTTLIKSMLEWATDGKFMGKKQWLWKLNLQRLILPLNIKPPWPKPQNSISKYYHILSPWPFQHRNVVLYLVLPPYFGFQTFVGQVSSPWFSCCLCTRPTSTPATTTIGRRWFAPHGWDMQM